MSVCSLCPFECADRVEDRHCGGIDFILSVSCGLRIEQCLCRGNSGVNTGKVHIVGRIVKVYHIDCHFKQRGIRIGNVRFLEACDGIQHILRIRLNLGLPVSVFAGDGVLRFLCSINGSIEGCDEASV